MMIFIRITRQIQHLPKDDLYGAFILAGFEAGSLPLPGSYPTFC